MFLRKIFSQSISIVQTNLLLESLPLALAGLQKLGYV